MNSPEEESSSRIFPQEESSQQEESCPGTGMEVGILAQDGASNIYPVAQISKYIFPFSMAGLKSQRNG